MFSDNFGKYPINVRGYTLRDIFNISIYWKLPDSDLKQRLVLMLRKKRRYRKNEIIYEKICSEIDVLKYQEILYFRTKKRYKSKTSANLNTSLVVKDLHEENSIAEQKILLESIHDKIDDLQQITEEHQKMNMSRQHILLLIFTLITLLLTFQNYFS